MPKGEAETPCEYCGGTLIKKRGGFYECEDCGRGVSSRYIDE